jgi:Lipid A 3-O-deacylase (PagL)
VSVRVQHVSNGGIRNPNDGLTYGSVVFRYNFQ